MFGLGPVGLSCVLVGEALGLCVIGVDCVIETSGAVAVRERLLPCLRRGDRAAHRRR